MTVLLLTLAAVFLIGFTFGCVIGHASVADVPEDIRESPPELTETTDECTPSATSQPQAETSESESPRYRDDIISGGRLLSYELQGVMQDCCERCDVPYALALAIADVESRFDPDAESSTSDYGLMQINRINFDWLRELGMDPLTPEGNIAAGVYIIGLHLSAFEDTELAVMAYNNGAAGARKLLAKGISHTGYSQRVMASYAYWKGILGD